MELKVKYSSKFKKGLKLAAKRGLDILVLTLINTGTHADLFGE